jgi:alpha-galactosidase
MVDRFKVAYIGAGSFRFSTPFFMDMANMSAKHHLPLEVGLCDVDEKSLVMMDKYFKRIVAKAQRQHGADITVFSSTDRIKVLENADFVYKSISIGMQDSEWYDNYLPMKFGIPQNTGDTVGPGGVFRGLRTNPVAAEMAKDVKKYCPKAPVLNYTNPQATIVMAARTVCPDVQWIGLCHELFGGMGTIKNWLAKYQNLEVARWEDLEYEYGGVNHFAWLTKLAYKGEDLYPKLRDDAHKLVMEKFSRPFNFFLLKKHGYFPYPGSRHVAEFMFEYYNYFNHKVQSPYWNFPVIRNVPQLATARRLAYRAMKLSSKGLFWVPSARSSGEKALEMTMDWKFNAPNLHVVNLPNKGIIPELPEDCTVEIPAFFKDGQITPKGTIHMPKEVVDLVRPHAEQHRYTVNGALGNSMELVIKAMQHDPMCGFIEDPDKIEFLTKLMLYYQQEWLPPQWKEWIPSEAELKESKWWVAPKDLIKDNKEYLKVMFPPKEELKSKAFFWKN